MKKSNFRLQSLLDIHAYQLENIQILLAEESKILTNYLEEERYLNELLLRTLEGKKAAGLHRPEDLVYWEKYLFRINSALQKCKASIQTQQKKVNDIKEKTVTVLREKKKYELLKDKFHKSKVIKELKTEQAVIDESAQNLFFKKRIYFEVI